MIARLVGFTAVLAVCLSGQTDRRISGGALGGTPLLHAFDVGPGTSTGDCRAACYVSEASPATKYYTFGAAVEVRLPRGLAVELDVLYSRLTFSAAYETRTPSSGLRFVFSKSTADRWEIPLLAKYRFSRGAARPFAVAGPAIDFPGKGHSEADLGGQDISGHVGVQHSSVGSSTLSGGPRVGVTLGGGVEMRLRVLRVSPQFRYAQWFGTQFASDPLIRSSPHEAALLLSLMF